MSAEVVTGAEREPRRARYLLPRGLPRRGEILAACVLLIVLGHVLFGQLTMVLAAAFYLITKMTRWRLSWLMIPAAAAVAWTIAVGPRTAAAGFAEGPAQVARYLGASGQQVRHLFHITAAFAGIGRWLPRQLPLAILAGAAEAALAAGLSWLHTDEWNVRPARPGLIVAVRRAATVRAIRAGGVVTREGGSLGVRPGCGARVALSWSEAAGGISVCGSAERDGLAPSFQLGEPAGGRCRVPARGSPCPGPRGPAGYRSAARPSGTCCPRAFSWCTPRCGGASRCSRWTSPVIRICQENWPWSAPSPAPRCRCSVTQHGAGMAPRTRGPGRASTRLSVTAIPPGGLRW